MQPLKHLGQPLCTLCPLHESAKTICVMGNGNAAAKVMIIGEAPGANEDATGEPFVGRAGEVLDKALADAGLPREQVYVTNLVKCRPPKNRDPKQEEIEACVEYLIREYRQIWPTHVLLLGNVALHTLTNIKGGITKHRGYINQHNSAFTRSDTFATFHPAATFRSKDNLEIFRADIRMFVQAVQKHRVAELQRDFPFLRHGPAEWPIVGTPVPSAGEA